MEAAAGEKRVGEEVQGEARAGTRAGRERGPVTARGRAPSRAFESWRPKGAGVVAEGTEDRARGTSDRASAGDPRGGSEERSQGPASRLWRRVVCEGEGMGSGAYLQPEEPDEGGFLGEA